MAAKRIAILSMNPWRAPGGYQPFSYAAYRIEALLVSDPALDADVRVIDSAEWTVDEWVRQVERHDPDVIGVSAYMWGLPTFVEVTRRLKSNRRDRTVVFGGPSARPAHLSLPPYQGCGQWIDALVLFEGEDSIREVVALHGQGREALQQVAGLALPYEGGWSLLLPGRPSSIWIG